MASEQRVRAFLRVRMRQVPPVTAAEYLKVLDEAMLVKTWRKEVVTRFTAVFLYAKYKKAVFYPIGNCCNLSRCLNAGC